MHKKKQENIFINPTFSLDLLLFFVRMAPFSSQHGYIFSFFWWLYPSPCSNSSEHVLFGISYFQFLALVERVPPFVTLRFFEFLPLKLAICNAFFYLVYFGVVKDSDRDDRPWRWRCDKYLLKNSFFLN